MLEKQLRVGGGAGAVADAPCNGGPASSSEAKHIQLQLVGYSPVNFSNGSATGKATWLLDVGCGVVWCGVSSFFVLLYSLLNCRREALSAALPDLCT
jgi:hypothetical protein